MNSEKRLAPGFRQVDAFNPDDDYERDENGDVIEEVSYVTLDLGAVEPTLVPSSSTYRLIVRGILLILSTSTRLITCRD
jgi:general transcription factor 3C polypeptide 6